ncbi:MAG: hypothetical protein H6Q14_236 [Bacteroidetes bacterium]|nr:hypothetical protein [Bacteroidota bacterium]
MFYYYFTQTYKYSIQLSYTKVYLTNVYASIFNCLK